MDFHYHPWALIDKMHHNRESWFHDLGSEGGIEIDYDCIHAFNKTGNTNIDELAKDLYLYLDSDIVLHVIKAFIEHMKAPKKDRLRFPKPKLEPVPKAVIAAPTETLKERPQYVPPVPFPRTMERHILLALLAEKKEA
jgi:hypothetical protein